MKTYEITFEYVSGAPKEVVDSEQTDYRFAKNEELAKADVIAEELRCGAVIKIISCRVYLE